MTAAPEQRVVSLEVEAVVPTVETALQAQGIPPDVTPNWRTLELAEEAREIFRRLAKPVGVWAPVTRTSFAELFRGEGQNAPATPVDVTANQADELAMFAVTVGPELPAAIVDLFDRQDPALGSMLDGYASEGVELAADLLEHSYTEWLRRESRVGPESGVLRYSPGYCGWHVSGQRKLFDYLGPQQIGIELRESCLMQPLKSISGVIFAGRREIFEFENTFDFCEECSTWACRERIGAVLGGAGNGDS
jgi:hypothetical protein